MTLHWVDTNDREAEPSRELDAVLAVAATDIDCACPSWRAEHTATSNSISGPRVHSAL